MIMPAPGPGAAIAPFPEQWSLLIRRSIFARGGVPAPVPGTASPDAAGPDGHIALRGVVLEDNSQYSAFLEDTAGNRTMRVRPGDSVGMGRVKAINLDSLVFETPLRTTHVQVGQNLLGAPLPAAQPQPAGPPGPPPGGPPPGAVANLPPGVTPDMAKQMMGARRARWNGFRPSRTGSGAAVARGNRACLRRFFVTFGVAASVGWERREPTCDVSDGAARLSL